jgi:hypothetical protein
VMSYPRKSNPGSTHPMKVLSGCTAKPSAVSVWWTCRVERRRSGGERFHVVLAGDVLSHGVRISGWSRFRRMTMRYGPREGASWEIIPAIALL